MDAAVFYVCEYQLVVSAYFCVLFLHIFEPFHDYGRMHIRHDQEDKQHQADKRRCIVVEAVALCVSFGCFNHAASVLF